MSRLLDALRHLQTADDASQQAAAPKVTPRLSASMRKAVLQEAPATITPRPAPDVLFRIPATDAASVPAAAPAAAAPAAAAPAAPAPATLVVAPPALAPVEAAPIESASLVKPSARVKPPDPVRLIEVIQASISAVQQESAPQQASTAEVAPPPAASTAPLRPTATAAEAELRALLASEVHARPYREMLAMVQRDVGGKAKPIVAIVGLDGQESTEHVAAALGTLIAEQAKDHAVLLIDANSRRTLARRYAAQLAVGLTELLAGRVERPAAILPTSHERLELLPFGLATAEQAQLLPAVLPAALQQARGTHAVVIDAGPISTPWALNASQAADAVYLVVRVGDTSAEHATSCVQRFRSAGGKLTGCIAVGPLPS